MEKVYVVLTIILILGALLRIPLVAQGFFAFTYDQGRDLLAVKQIIETHKLTLIGPTTGLPGIFYGPWWYYFLVPLFIASKGNPVAITLDFAVIGIANILLTFLLIRKITKNNPIALGAAFIVSMSHAFITASSQIWSPSLALPVMLLYIYSLVKITEKPRKLWFFISGLSAALVMETGAAFGIVLTIATAVTFLLVKQFPKKYIPYFLIGVLTILLPRIIFDLRHEFLMTEAVSSWLTHPKVYQEKLNIVQRLISRVNVFYLILAQTFTQSNKFLAAIPALTIIYAIYSSRLKIFKNTLFKTLFLVAAIILGGFTLYPDAVWDYYLAGLPVIFIILFAVSVSNLKHKNLASIILVITVAISFNTKIFSPFKITWQDDGAIYKNQKAVMEYLKNDLKGDYSLYFYTPARFDYAFDYIVAMYHTSGQVDLPKENQKRIYLVIRDDSSHLYLPTGWYGDKTRGKSKLLEKKIFPGSIIVEKHQF